MLQDQKRNPAYGADVLRLWVAHCGLDTCVHTGPTLLSECRERLFRVNSCFFVVDFKFHFFE